MFNSGAMSGTHIRRYQISRTAWFSNTSAKTRFPSSLCLLLLKLRGRQTLCTQWFPRLSWTGDAIHVQSVPPPSFHWRQCLTAKRYVCAAQSSEALSSILVAQRADSPNATCVRPARFRASRHVTTCRSGPAKGSQTLQT